ncbi:MAG TPA: serine hydrolase domain-containing protein [Dehalococcoidia bacterium]|nr:serine hydrolase domain-containing protein [Dehalococcoidia bacterium]
MVKTLETRALIEAEPEDVGMSSARLENVSRVVQSYVDDAKYAGAISMVARRGKVVHFETYGNMDDEAGKPVMSDTIYRIYSMTKPIVSVALMTLYEDGRFQLDDPASKFIPQFKGIKVFERGDVDSYQTREASREVTIRDLLTHCSGLTASGTTSPVAELYQRAGLRGSSSDGTLVDFINKLGSLPLKCDPGAEWNYGVSTDVVGYLCEVMSGQRLDHFLRQRILDPLGMKDTGFQVPQHDIYRFAANYKFGGENGARYTLSDAPATSPYTMNRTYLSGAGGLVSTASDYMRFCKMLANGGELDGARIIGPRTLRFMTMNHLPGGKDLAALNSTGPTESARDGVGFGLGFAVLLDPSVSQTLGTPGEYYWGGAASTAFFVSPAEDLIMLFLTQLQPSSSYPIRRELRVAIHQAIID